MSDGGNIYTINYTNLLTDKMGRQLTIYAPVSH